MSEAHYDVISNIAGFTCTNEDHHKTEYKKCKACKIKQNVKLHKDILHKISDSLIAKLVLIIT